MFKKKVGNNKNEKLRNNLMNMRLTGDNNIVANMSFVLELFTFETSN